MTRFHYSVGEDGAIMDVFPAPISVCDFYRNAIGSAEEVFVFLKVRNNS